MNRPNIYIKQAHAIAAWLRAQGDPEGSDLADSLAEHLNVNHDAVDDQTTPDWTIVPGPDALDAEPAIRCWPEVGCVFEGEDGPVLTIDPCDGGDVSIVHMGDVARWMSRIDADTSEKATRALGEAQAKLDAERIAYDATVARRSPARSSSHTRSDMSQGTAISPATGNDAAKKRGRERAAQAVTDTTVERLDFSKPPPGYTIAPPPAHLRPASPGPATLAAAWAHYKAHHDPPGGPESWVDNSDPLLADFEREVRAAGWARYERRLALAGKVDTDYRLDGPGDAGDATSAWPRCLTWSNGQVAAVEHWLADAGAEMPEVLRG